MLQDVVLAKNVRDQKEIAKSFSEINPLLTTKPVT